MSILDQGLGKNQAHSDIISLMQIHQGFKQLCLENMISSSSEFKKLWELELQRKGVAQYFHRK